jgi:hypothetical protein
LGGFKAPLNAHSDAIVVGLLVLGNIAIFQTEHVMLPEEFTAFRLLAGERFERIFQIHLVLRGKGR